MPSDPEDERLRALHDAGREAHRGVDLSFDAFRAAARRFSSHPVAPAADLYLAAACDAGAPGAWETLALESGPRLRGLLRSRGADENQVDALLSDLPGHLCEPPAGAAARTRIGTYAGASRLFTFVAAIALRSLADERRRPAGVELPDSGSQEPSGRITPPLTRLLRAETMLVVGPALVEGLNSLTERERLAVLWKYRDGMAQREIARLFEVGEPRVSRILQTALAKVRSAVTRRMGESSIDADSSLWRVLAAAVAEKPASPGGHSDQQDEVTT